MRSGDEIASVVAQQLGGDAGVDDNHLLGAGGSGAEVPRPGRDALDQEDLLEQGQERLTVAWDSRRSLASRPGTRSWPDRPASIRTSAASPAPYGCPTTRVTSRLIRSVT